VSGAALAVFASSYQVLAAKATLKPNFKVVVPEQEMSVEAIVLPPSFKVLVPQPHAKGQTILRKSSFPNPD
jgi:hypothetical protein